MVGEPHWRVQRVGVGISEISHVIPLRLFQCFKSERWNSAVFEMLMRSVVRELRAELVNAGTVVRRRLRVIGNGPPEVRRGCACVRGCCTRSVGGAPVLIGCSVP